jgi:hypothetical protein
MLLVPGSVVLEKDTFSYAKHKIGPILLNVCRRIFWPARLQRLTGRYDNPMPESTISPSQGLRIWLQEWKPVAYSKPVFVDLLRSPGIDSRHGGPVRQPYLSYLSARLHRLAESLHRNRFLGTRQAYRRSGQGG